MERTLALLIAFPIAVLISHPCGEKANDNIFVVAEVSETVAVATNPTTEVEITEVTEEVVIEETIANESVEEVHAEIVIEVVPNEIPEEELKDEKQGKDWHTGLLTARKGFITDGPAGENGNDGYETWYDLDMTGVVAIMDELMKKKGEEDGCVYDYEYWVREDGCKMYGPYIMVAGDIKKTRKRGDIIETSRGIAMVCDHCEQAERVNHYQIDIATDWAHTYSSRI